MGSGHELREAPHPPGGAADGGSLWDQVRDLAEDFPCFEIGTQPSWRGISLVAVRRDDGGPGVRVVITTDPAEMREALAQAAEGRRSS
jgi:hypothetical protein